MSFTREQYLEIAKNAAALYVLVRDDMSGAHRHKMRGKALASFIMDQCEQVIGDAFTRPDRNNALHQAVARGDVEIARRLEEKFKVSRR